MISVGRLSAGRTASRLARQQRYAAPKIAESSPLGGRGAAASSALNLPAGRAIVSMAKPPPRLPAAGGRPLSASAVVPEKLVTMVPWVPPPFQPLMDKLHPIMIAPRRPMAWLGVEALDTTTNYGALCGHFSFALLTLAYIETDVLKLR